MWRWVSDVKYDGDSQARHKWLVITFSVVTVTSAKLFFPTNLPEVSTTSWAWSINLDALALTPNRASQIKSIDLPNPVLFSKFCPVITRRLWDGGKFNLKKKSSANSQPWILSNVLENSCYGKRRVDWSRNPNRKSVPPKNEPIDFTLRPRTKFFLVKALISMLVVVTTLDIRDNVAVRLAVCTQNLIQFCAHEGKHGSCLEVWEPVFNTFRMRVRLKLSGMYAGHPSSSWWRSRSMSR